MVNLYKKAGVNIEKGNDVVKRIKNHVDYFASRIQAPFTRGMKQFAAANN